MSMRPHIYVAACGGCDWACLLAPVLVVVAFASDSSQ